MAAQTLASAYGSHLVYRIIWWVTGRRTPSKTA
jgi:hypothetical protein